MIKALDPFDRILIEFKGPLPSASKNKYLLTVVDEFTQYPFAFPCSDITAATVIKCLSQIFAVFGLPRYVHSDRAASFMSRELKEYLHNKLVATRHSSPYNPTGNSQVERFNGIIRRTVKLALKTRGLPVTHWENVLMDALHSIRSLLCTATNCTPHERMFSFPRRAACGPSLPSWLTPGKVFLRRFNRSDKNSPLVEEVELLDVNPTYVNVRYPDGQEMSIALRHLAPCPRDEAAGQELFEHAADVISREGPLSSAEESDSAHGVDDSPSQKRTAPARDSGSPPEPVGHLPESASVESPLPRRSTRST